MEYIHLIWDFIKEWYWIPISLIYISVIITILIENRNPEKTIAWILIIVFVPLLGILFYYLFGQKFQKEKYFRKLDKHLQQEILTRWKDLHPIIEKEVQAIGEPFGSVFQYLINTRTSSLTLKNKISLLFNGEQKFPALLEAMENARHHIHLEYYIFDDDTTGRTFIELMKKKVKEGVIVRLMTDDFGSPRLSKLRKELLDSGIDFQVFLPVHFNSLANSNYRNHRKIAIIDGNIGFTGGINISDKYCNQSISKNKNELYWRDTSVRLEGDAVRLLEIYFFMNWRITRGALYHLDENYLKETTLPSSIPVSFALTSPGELIPSGMESVIAAIMKAKTSVRICTPYFIPGEAFKSALMIAASKGVHIELMLPLTGDSTVVQYASLSFLKPLLERNVEVFLYEKGFMHAKTVVVDDQLSFVGTMNLDIRSFYINFEITSLILCEKTAAELNRQFDEDRLVSRRMTLNSWTNEKWYKKGFASVCRLLAPLL